MKTKILFLLLLIAGFAGAQVQSIPTGSQYPPYVTVNTVPPINSSTGNNLNYAYFKILTPPTSHDTIRVVTNARSTKIWVDSLSGGAVILADTAGDTAAYYNAFNGIAGATKKWFRKNPFQNTYENDELQLTINGSKVAYRKVTLPWLFVIPGDSLHVPKKGTVGTGGVTAKFVYSYTLNQWICTGQSAW